MVLGGLTTTLGKSVSKHALKGAEQHSFYWFLIKSKNVIINRIYFNAKRNKNGSLTSCACGYSPVQLPESKAVFHNKVLVISRVDT